MAKASGRGGRPMAKPIPNGTQVSWHYRSAIGHGSIQSVRKPSPTAANIEYNIKETDHHPGEPAVVHHYGRALRRS